MKKTKKPKPEEAKLVLFTNASTRRRRRAYPMRPLAEAAGFAPAVHKWQLAERAELLAELDAAFFVLYGIERDEMGYILSTFSGRRKQAEADAGFFPHSASIEKAYERLTDAT